MLENIHGYLESLPITKNIFDVPIYYINMNKSIDRRIHMESMCKKYNVVPTRIEAIDGRIATNIITTNILLSKPELGCAASHFAAYAQVVKDGHPIALILEDDVEFNATRLCSESLMQIAENAPVNWDVILVGYLYKPTDKYSKLVVDRGAYAYLVSRKYAEKMTNVCIKNGNYYVQNVSDAFIGAENGYMSPMPIIYQYNINSDSTIHIIHTPFHINGALETTRYIIEKSYTTLVTSVK